MQLIHGGDLVSSRKRYPGVEPLDFSANINPLGMPGAVVEALERSAAACVHYPDPLCRELRAALSRFEGVPAGQILCSGGAADLIYRIAFGLRPRRALVLAPTFAEYELALHAVGCQVDRHALSEADDFVLNEDILNHIDGTQLVFLCNPNNPTGSLTRRPLLEKILARCRQAGAALIVDECFLDFVENGDSHSVKPLLAQGERLLILRAFTKIFAMPGLRLGYALCGDAHLLEQVERAGPPWSVSTPAQLCGCAAVEETAYLAKTLRVVAEGRAQLTAGLTALGYHVYPSAANYLLFRGAPGLSQALAPEGILLRDCGNYYGLTAGYYRSAVRLPEENERLLGAVGAAVGPGVPRADPGNAAVMP